jgi:hypothetical protein
MEVAAVLSNKGELEMGAILSNLAVAVGIVFVLLIAPLRAEVAKAGGKGEEMQSRCGRATHGLCCGAALDIAKVMATEVEVVVDAAVWAERRKTASTTANRGRLAMKASARAATAAAGAASHANWRAACAKGAGWPAAAAAMRAAAAVGQCGVNASTKSVRDAELAVSSSASAFAIPEARGLWRLWRFLRAKQTMRKLLQRAGMCICHSAVHDASAWVFWAFTWLVSVNRAAQPVCLHPNCLQPGFSANSQLHDP